MRHRQPISNISLQFRNAYGKRRTFVPRFGKINVMAKYAATGASDQHHDLHP
jgi:hypothetical protein